MSGPLTSHQFVRDHLRRSIIKGEVPGGKRLIQNEIAAKYGVSTTPVREALRDLATEGLIQLDAHRGAFVHEVDSKEFEEIYEMRSVLEPLAIRQSIARITDEEIESAARVQELADQEVDTGRWVDLNRQFHAIFIDAARSERLSSVLHQLRDSSSLYVGFVLRRDPEFMAKANHEHLELVEAFRARNLDDAIAVSLRHLRGTHDSGIDDLSG